MKNYITIIVIMAIGSFFSSIIAQNQELLDNNWFVQEAKESAIYSTELNVELDMRFEITFLSDKIILSGCCGGTFEVGVNYIGDDSIQIVSLTEVETISCNHNFTTNFYNSIKGVFTSLIGAAPVEVVVLDDFFTAGVKYFYISHPTESKYILAYNIPNEIDAHTRHPYWGHEPPTHMWSLTEVQYQDEVFELPYGAALTTADIFEGTFTISLCGEILVAFNFSSELHMEDYEGPCFISCGILENTMEECEPLAGYDTEYLEGFKQSVFNFLTDNLNELMYYTFTFGPSRKLIIEKMHPLGDKLVFHSNANYASIDESVFASNITIYPNPTANNLFIYKQQEGIISVNLYTITGQLLLQKEFGNTNNFISLENLQSGTYFLVIENQLGEKTVKKVVKK